MLTRRAQRKAAGGTAAQQPARRNAGGAGVKKATFDIAKKKEVGVSDLTLLSKISDEAINDNLHKRFQNGTIYTYIGHVLISVNPFRDLGIYTDEVLASYQGKNRLEVPPHVFAIAEAMYYNLKSYNESQCVIISGESGAGKTEAAKRIMQYIASSSTGSGQIQKIKEMVLATNPLLESFGCAKTLRNDNSSRHGKYLEILFNSQAQPIGAKITNYLLEKARVVGQIRNERNFHIFYQFTKGASQQYKEIFGVQPPESYVYTSMSRCTSVGSIDDVKDFADTIKAMGVIGLTQQEQDNIFRMLAAILWIGNIQFVEGDDGTSAVIADMSVPTFVAYLLEVDAPSIEKALTIKIVETSHGMRRGSVYESPLNPVQANAVRDALAKQIYNNLFDWIVERVNVALRAEGSNDSSSVKTIGILDIYGFEIFEQNSFEQLCINYVNEKLQQIFIELTLKSEQDEYIAERIQWTPIKYFNNKIVCDLIEQTRPKPGIFAALNDAVATAHADSSAADQNFVMRLGLLSDNPHFQPRQNKFLIRHYAGDVLYETVGVTDKNKDQMAKDLSLLVTKSANQFVQTLFPQNASEEPSGGRHRRSPTASDKIKASANDLTKTLSMAHPSYIRTIKPNQNRSPTEYDEKAVLHQVKYLGLQENVRIRRAGFAYRQTFDKFAERFYLLSSKTSYAGDYIWQGDHQSACLQILKDTKIPATEYQIGVTKVFIKTPETLFALEHMRDMYWHNMASRIQRAWRKYWKHKTDQAIKIQRWWREMNGNSDTYEFRDKGHSIYHGQKERRRFSLLGYRKFLGDYLDCNSVRSPGGFMVRSLKIDGEQIEFSARGEELMSKFGRSSSRVHKVFLLTRTKFFVINEAIINNQLTYQTERMIPVSSIRSISVSQYRDDWFAINLQSASEPDPLLWCVLKTELLLRLSVLRPGLSIKVGPTISYNKKPGKATIVKFALDNTAGKYDIYKSGTVRVPNGSPANSVSEPVPKSKPKARKPAPPRQPRQQRAPVQRSNPVAPPVQQTSPQRQPVQRQPVQRQPVQQQPVQQQPVQQHPVQQHPVQQHPVQQQPFQQQPVQQQPVQQQPVQQQPVQHTPASNGAARKVPPPPPPPPAQNVIHAKVLYDFGGNSENELPITAGQIIVISKKENNGWWLAKHEGQIKEGWVPSAYVEEIKGRKGPPPPPPPANSGGAADLGSGLAQALKKKKESDGDFAGGLAQALKARQQHDSDDDNDDW